MPSYKAPVDDYIFLLHDLLKIQDHKELPGFADLEPDFTRAILSSVGQFHEEVLHPANQAADEEGARLENGAVRAPAAFKTLAREYASSGWLAAGVSEKLGGAGLPPVVSAVISEIGAATAQSLRMYFAFCAPAAEMLNALGDAWMRDYVVPKLVACDWTATMAMTESHCGTDLRQIRTRAVRNADGTWRINGAKMFISGGDNDLSDNVVHIVLAKMPDADGTFANDLSSVGVFVVSKHRIDTETGALGERNGVSVASVEHKMGLGGNATCVLNFENAVAHRIAAPGKTGTSANMAAMFFLMNYARVGVALSGVAYAEIARQNAADYARERLSGRAAAGPVNKDGPADPIIVHPDIRRLLVSSRAFTEGARAMAAKIAFMQSLARYTTDEDEKARLTHIMDVMTPVMKAYFTDKGFEATNACLQVLGGHGYIADYGLEHFVRNVRVGQIYEGANGIQAIDLIARKLKARGGGARVALFGAIAGFLAKHEGVAEMAEFIEPLKAAVATVNATLDQADAAAASDQDALGAAAYDILTMFGIMTVAWAWAEIAAVVVSGESRFLTEEEKVRKLALARYWMARELPMISALSKRALSRSDTLMAIDSALI